MGEMGTASSQRCRVWAVDLLGQGRSWPQRPPQPHHRLAFSVDTWTEQIADFIRYSRMSPPITLGLGFGVRFFVFFGTLAPKHQSHCGNPHFAVVLKIKLLGVEPRKPLTSHFA